MRDERLGFWVVALALATLAVSDVCAEPEVFLVSGNASHRDTLRIYGDNFGEKSPAHPLRYDDFESGTIGERLLDQASGGWRTYTNGSEYPHYTQDRQRVPGEKCAIQHYLASEGRYAQEIGLRDIDADTLYMTGWCYRDDYLGTANLCSNCKMWGNFSYNEGGVTHPQNRIDTYWHTNAGHNWISDCDGLEIQDNWAVGPAKYLNQWFRLERYVAMGTPSGDNGVSWAAANLQRIVETTGSFYTCGNPYDGWFVGHYFRTSDGASLKVYWSEMYVDNTLARVELGNSANWDDCTQREIQIPISWSTTAVSVICNTGTFESGETVYLFVVDKNGDHSPIGRSVVIGESEESEYPGQPSQPRIVGD